MWTTAQLRRLTETPYADALDRQAGAGIASFHALPIGSLAHAPDGETSAHAEQARRLFGPRMLAAELTLGSPELDSYFRAHRSLARSRRLSAEAFGAAETHYVTTGTTGANQIALEALRSGTARVLVDRSMHQSVHFALDRLAASVDYAPTAADTAEHGVITALRRARESDVRYDVVVIGVSAYDGSLVQMRRFLAVLHELTADTGIAVLVDEAWTAIHSFHPAMRRNAAVACVREALEDHPDWSASFLVTQSAHKSMLALRQGSYVHLLASPDRLPQLSADVSAAVYRVHTTSPSLPILASLDLARAHAVAEGEHLVERALTLAGGRAGATASPESIAMAAGPDSDGACLADAISDPGPAGAYSAAGYRRVTALAAELGALRGHLGHCLPDLVAEVRRVLGVDCEVRAAAAGQPWTGAEHLDAFADVVAAYAERTTDVSVASVAGLLAYLDVAEEVENGLPPAAPAVARDRVQVLTVHSAKGLEWQVVAVAHLSGGIFPSTASRSTWLTDAAELPPLLRGDRAAAGSLGIPVLDTSDVTNRKQLSDKIFEHRRQLEQRRVDEERRLLYVAITRAEDTLLVSGHQWGSTGIKPRGPSEFLCELKDIIDGSAAAGDPCGAVDEWAPAPADGERNPMRDNVVEAIWPADPLDAHRGDVEAGAALVVQAMSADVGEPGADAEGWAADVDALLAERAGSQRRPARALPSQVSVSGLVDLARDPAAAAQRLVHRLPTRPDPHASLGTAFHGWVQQFYGADSLFDLGDLPGAADSGIGDIEELAALQATFAESRWAARTPVAVEVPFDMPIGDTVVRGRIDAVFADPDGGATVVDWKTGEPPRGAEAMRQAAVQLAVYRLAWAALSGVPESAVRTAFYYVRTGATVTPDELPEPAELAALLAGPAGGGAVAV